MPAFVTTAYVDDLDGTSIDAKNVDSVEFSHRGTSYTLVLTKDNGAQFDKDMARYIKAAKKAATQVARASRGQAGTGSQKSTVNGNAAASHRKSASPRKAVSARKSAPTRKATSQGESAAPRKANAAAAGPARLKAIREWAAANGHTVSARGRIPTAVVEAFDAAN